MSAAAGGGYMDAPPAVVSRCRVPGTEAGRLSNKRFCVLVAMLRIHSVFNIDSRIFCELIVCFLCNILLHPFSNVGLPQFSCAMPLFH